MKLFFCFAVLAFAGPALAQSPNKAENSIWEIKNRQGSGTGFAVGQKHILTSLSVAALLSNQKGGRITLSQWNETAHLPKKGQSHEAALKVVRISALYDLAILEIEDMPKEGGLELIGEKDSIVNSELAVLAYLPGGLQHIQQTSPILYEGQRFIGFPVDQSNLKGASGSPALNPAGQVVGLYSKSAENLSLVIISPHLRKFINGQTGLNCEGASLLECVQKELSALQIQAAQGSALAQYQLAAMSERGIAVERAPAFKHDLAAAKNLYEAAARQGHVLSQYSLALLLHGEQPEEARKWYEKAAQKHFPPAENNLAILLKTKNWGDQNQIIHLLVSSAKRGYAPAQHNLGIVYESLGEIEKALEWYRAAALQKFAPAIHNLYLAHILRPYNPQQMAQAPPERIAPALLKTGDKIYDILLKHGDPETLYDLAVAYGEKERNSQKALSLLEKSAKRGYAPAQHHLALIYDKTKEREKALSLFERSAQQGYAPAQYHLALIYDKTKEREKSLFFLKEAAKGGYAPAQYRLGLYYKKRGELDKALTWLEAANNQNFIPAMSQIKEIKELKKCWKSFAPSATAIH